MYVAYVPVDIIIVVLWDCCIFNQLYHYFLAHLYKRQCWTTFMFHYSFYFIKIYCINKEQCQFPYKWYSASCCGEVQCLFHCLDSLECRYVMSHRSCLALPISTYEISSESKLNGQDFGDHISYDKNIYIPNKGADLSLRHVMFTFWMGG